MVNSKYKFKPIPKTSKPGPILAEEAGTFIENCLAIFYVILISPINQTVDYANAMAIDLLTHSLTHTELSDPLLGHSISAEPRSEMTICGRLHRSGKSTAAHALSTAVHSSRPPPVTAL
ncbi:unnamed protein product [[Candida] boidinii]|uniref:Unnamed protein product n=1 Tax=Candida boidinii TaxID=5477 RepID=A0ACB5U8T4_CANBO|nr:unnamed protein product [[Candida] boidinii]